MSEPRDEYLAQHAIRVEIRQDMDTERHRAHGLPEEEIRPDVAGMNRGIALSLALKSCWRV